VRVRKQLLIVIIAMVLGVAMSVYVDRRIALLVVFSLALYSINRRDRHAGALTLLFVLFTIAFFTLLLLMAGLALIHAVVSGR
jgi:hypothetical protein